MPQNQLEKETVEADVNKIMRLGVLSSGIQYSVIL
jgi:hypothetical protein